MTEFSYTAISPNTYESVKGVIAAASPQAARAEMRSNGFHAITIDGAMDVKEVDSADRDVSVPPESSAFFTRQLSIMTAAGVPLMKSIDSLADTEIDPELKVVLEDIFASLGAGNSFGDAVAQHPMVFDDYYVAMVRAGESSDLSTILIGLADIMERQARPLV